MEKAALKLTLLLDKSLEIKGESAHPFAQGAGPKWEATSSLVMALVSQHMAPQIVTQAIKTQQRQKNIQIQPPCDQASCYKVPVPAVLKAFAFVPLIIFCSNEKNERREGKGSRMASCGAWHGHFLSQGQGWWARPGRHRAGNHLRALGFGLQAAPSLVPSGPELSLMEEYQLTSPNKPCQMGLHHPTSPARLILVNEPSGQLLLGASSHPCLATANQSLKSFGISLCSAKRCGLSPWLAPKCNKRAV